MTSPPEGSRPAPTIRPLRAERVPEAILVLAEALVDDPGWTYVVPDAAARRIALRCLVGTAIRDARPFGAVLAAEERGELAGAAVWVPPGLFPMTLPRRLRALPSMLALTVRIPRQMRRLARFGASLERVFPTEPVWYLQALGVVPAAQRRGFGRALVTSVLDRADRDRTACYLETGKPQNVRYYETMGFAVVRGGMPLYDGGPVMWTMRRPRATSHGSTP